MKLGLLKVLPLVAICLSLSAAASAADLKVKITSFTTATLQSRIAELCGTVLDNGGKSASVRVVVDPKSGHPGTYNTSAGADGKFCVVVLTHDGEADATAQGN